MSWWTSPKAASLATPERPRGPVPLAWPRWVNDEERYNLRWVAPDLLVGAVESPAYARALGVGGVVSFTGTSRAPEGMPRLHRPFEDGDNFPPGALDDLLGFYRSTRARGPLLIHCQAGLSRSASAAYALLRISGLTHPEALARVQVPGLERFPMARTLASARTWARDVRIGRAR